MSPIRIGSPVAALSGAVAVLWLTPAYPHAVCGARTFPATLAIDDPGLGASLSWAQDDHPRI